MHSDCAPQIFQLFCIIDGTAVVGCMGASGCCYCVVIVPKINCKQQEEITSSGFGSIDTCQHINDDDDDDTGSNNVAH